MRFCRSGPHLMLFVIAHTAIVLCSRVLICCLAEYADSIKLTDLQSNGQNTKFHERSDDFVSISSKTASRSERRRRQSANADFTWKVTKTPKFVTAKTEKPVEPILRVYPLDLGYRSGRSREFVASQRNIGTGGASTGTGTGNRRVIYYATLPEVVRYSSNALPVAGERYAIANQQRSFAPSKGGKEFVTRVQSSIIDVRPRGENKKEIGATPTFTIIDAHPNPTPYSGYPQRMHYADYNVIANVDKQNYGNYHVPPSYYHNNPKSQYELLPSHNPMKAYYANPYYNLANVDKSQYQINHLLYQQQQQASPYFTNDIGKVSSPYYSPPYPSRHTRFPIDRYPVTSPLGLSHPDIGLPPNTSPSLSESHSDLNNANYHSYQPNLGFDGPPSTYVPSLHSSNGLDFNSNFGSSIDHGIDFDDHHNISPLKDKFLDYNSLSQKYLDLNGFGHDFPFKYDHHKDPFKFDKEPFKGPFSQVSDWLTSKPFDLSSLDLDDSTGGTRDYQIKGSAHSVVVDSQTQMHNQNITTSSNNMNDSNNTVITPFTSTNNSSTSNISQDENTKRDYQ